MKFKRGQIVKEKLTNTKFTIIKLEETDNDLVHLRNKVGEYTLRYKEELCSNVLDNIIESCQYLITILKGIEK